MRLQNMEITAHGESLRLHKVVRERGGSGMDVCTLVEHGKENGEEEAQFGKARWDAAGGSDEDAELDKVGLRREETKKVTANVKGKGETQPVVKVTDPQLKTFKFQVLSEGDVKPLV